MENDFPNDSTCAILHLNIEQLLLQTFWTCCPQNYLNSLLLTLYFEQNDPLTYKFLKRST